MNHIQEIHKAGVDLAKNVIQVFTVDDKGKAV